MMREIHRQYYEEAEQLISRINRAIEQAGNNQVNASCFFVSGLYQLSQNSSRTSCIIDNTHKILQKPCQNVCQLFIDSKFELNKQFKQELLHTAYQKAAQISCVNSNSLQWLAAQAAQPTHDAPRAINQLIASASRFKHLKIQLP